MDLLPFQQKLADQIIKSKDQTVFLLARIFKDEEMIVRQIRKAYEISFKGKPLAYSIIPEDLPKKFNVRIDNEFYKAYRFNKELKKIYVRPISYVNFIEGKERHYQGAVEYI